VGGRAQQHALDDPARRDIPDQTELGFRDEECFTSSQAGLLAALALSVAAVSDRI
jgi:hypothetical protein